MQSICDLSGVERRRAWRTGSFGRILKEVWLDPRAARYPSLLKICEWEPEWKDENGYSRDKVSESDLTLFKQAARNTIDSSREELEGEWLAAIDRGDEEPLIALLLMLLPNLRHIDFNPVDETYLCITDALRIIKYDKDSSSLRKLRSVNLELAKSDHDDVLDVELVILFAGLPHVTSIYSHGAGTCPEGHLCYYKIGVIQVTYLTFQFSYSHKGSAGNPTHFDPFWIRAALLANAQDSLLSLIVLAGGQETYFMGSLANFTCLENAYTYTDLRLLNGDPSSPDQGFQTHFQLSIVSITLHVDYSSDAACLKDNIQVVSDYPGIFYRLENITVVGVPDVRGVELSHDTLIKELERKPITLPFVTE